MRSVLVISLILLSWVPASGRDDPEDVRDTADQAREAFQDGDTDALERFATREDPQVWLVLDKMCARGVFDAADALAKAGPDAAREALVSFVATQRKQPVPAASREIFKTVHGLLVGRKSDEALVLLAKLKELPPSVFAAQVARLEGIALGQAGQPDAQIDRIGAAGLTAKAIGWTQGWFVRCYEAGDLALRRQDLVRCETWWTHGYEAAQATGKDPYTAEIGARLAICLSHRGKNARALEVDREVLPLFRRTNDPRSIAIMLGNIGNELTILGQLEEALATQTEALAMKRKIGDTKGIGATLGNIASIHSRRSDWDTALRIHSEALTYKRQAQDKPEIAASLASVGDIHRVLGDHATAFTYLEKSLAMYKGIDRKLSIGFVLGRLGVAHAQLGNWEKAFALGHKALRLLEGVGAERQAAHIRGSLAQLYRDSGDYEKALELQRQVLAYREEKGNVSQVSSAHQAIAGTYGSWSRPKEGMPHAEQALALAVKSGDQGSIAYANLALGDLFGRLGQYKKAVKRLAAALSDAEQMSDAKLTFAIHETRVEAAVTAKRPGTAVKSALAAAEVLRGQLRHLGHEERARAGALWMTSLVLGVQAARIADKPKDAFTLLEAGRASALREALGGGSALRAALIPADLRTAGADAAAAETAAAHRLRSAVESDAPVQEINAQRAALATARTRLEEVAVTIERTAKVAADVVQPRPAKLSHVQRLLRDGRTMLLFTVQGTDASVLIVTNKAVRHVGLGPAAEIRDACARLHAEGTGVLDEKALGELRALLVPPLGLRASDNRLWISPDGPLTYVPFSLLFQGAELGYIQSGSTAVQLSALDKVRGEQVLALGNPKYSDHEEEARAGALRSGFELAPLPASGEEAKAVGDVVLLGEDATEEGLARALAQQDRWRALHLACHGLVDPQRPSFCALALTPSEDSDGFLTALEIVRSRIPADLVVLSACDTGRGKIYDGEGLVGLTRAFMLAGSPRILVSLWRVDDKATGLLMKAFYAKLKRGGGAAAALRYAQEHVRTREETKVDPEASRRAGHTVLAKSTPYADTRYWAGWQLWGLWD